MTAQHLPRRPAPVTFVPLSRHGPVGSIADEHASRRVALQLLIIDAVHGSDPAHAMPIFLKQLVQVEAVRSLLHATIGDRVAERK